MIRRGEVALGRFHPVRGIVPSAAPDHLSRATLRPFGISPIAAREAFAEPIRRPLAGIACKILCAVGALTGLMAPHRLQTASVRARTRLPEIRARGGRLVVSPWI